MGDGGLLFSTLGLHEMGKYPEARALQNAIYRHLGSERFEPGQWVDIEVFEVVGEMCVMVPGCSQELYKNYL